MLQDFRNVKVYTYIYMYNTKQDSRLHGGANPPIVPKKVSVSATKKSPIISKKASVTPKKVSVSATRIASVSATKKASATRKAAEVASIAAAKAEAEAHAAIAAAAKAEKEAHIATAIAEAEEKASAVKEELIPVTKPVLMRALRKTIKGRSKRVASHWNSVRSAASKEGRAKLVANRTQRNSWWSMRQNRKVSGTTKKRYKTRRPRGRRPKTKRSKTRRSKVRG